MIVKSFFFITNRIEKIESKKLINAILNEKKHVFVMFVQMISDEIKYLNDVHIERRLQIDSAFAKMKKKNIKNFLFEVLKEFVDMTNKNKTYELFDHEFDDHAINLKSSKKSSYEFIYALSKDEFKILRTYLNKHLKNEFIKFFIFFANVSILFVKKKNEILRLCVNYKDFNFLTIKNRYFLSLIDENLNRLNKIRKYTSFDMITIYNRLRIKKENE